MKGRLYILTGASGCGKTTLLNSICDAPALSKELRAIKARKHSTRKRRGPDDDCCHSPTIDLNTFDIAYAINENLYGLKLSEIREAIDAGKNALIVISDFRIIRRLKEALREAAVCVYISSAIDPAKLQRVQLARHGFDPKVRARSRLKRQFSRLRSAARLNQWETVANCIGELNEDWKVLRPESDSTEVRVQRIRAFHTRYIDHIELFDHTILNYSEGHSDEMTLQIRNLIRSYDAGELPHSFRWPPIFVVAAASGAGKATMMHMLHLIGGDRVELITKMARREKKPGDKRDGMIAIGQKQFPPEYDFRWEFHKPVKAAAEDGRLAFKGVQYSVSSGQINERLQEGKSQIVISNIQQFPAFRERYGDNVVFIYLHRLSSREDIRKYQYENNDNPAEAKVRIEEIERVHHDYLEHVAEFSHVLLNTTFPEDLYDQVFQLLEYYHGLSRRA